MKQKDCKNLLKDFCKQTRSLRSETKDKLKIIIEYRTKGYSLDSISKHIGIAKARVHKLEKDFKIWLGSKDSKDYDLLIHEAKQKLTEIK